MASAFDVRIGLRLRELRERRSLSQTQLAALLDVTPGLIKHWEHGRASLRLDRIERLAQALNVAPAAFHDPPGAPLKLRRATVP